jgi:hypothetical protein
MGYLPHTEFEPKTNHGIGSAAAHDVMPFLVSALRLSFKIGSGRRRVILAVRNGVQRHAGNKRLDLANSWRVVQLFWPQVIPRLNDNL